MQKINILIADDHALIRQAWRYMLNTDPRFQVVGEVGSGEEAVEMAQVTNPDIVMLDIHLGGIDGLETTKLIRTYSPNSKIIAVSLHNQSFFVRGMMKNVASLVDFINKSPLAFESEQFIAPIALRA